MTIGETTTGATVYYTTDGTTPSASSTKYNGSSSISVAGQGTTTVKAIATKSGMNDSKVVSATFTINYNQTSTPQFSPSAGTYSSDQQVTLTDSTTGATIYYTTDGTSPTASSTKYTGAISVAGDGTTKTIKAFATASGMNDSNVASATYTISYSQVSTPQLSPAAGTYATDQQVLITDSTSGVTIHYTTDGSTPTSSSPTYSAAISVSGDGVTETIKAVAIKSGMKESTVATGIYAIQYPHTVTFNAQGGSSPNPTSISVVYGQPYGTLATTSRTGYTFAGWWTGTGGTGTHITSSTTVGVSGNQTLYAAWTANTYAVTFDSQGGSLVVSKTVTYDSTYGTMPTTTRTGYAFSGWWTSSSGGSQIITSTAVVITSNQTLYAHWTANSYTVTFNAVGGATPSPSSKTVTYGGTYGTLPTTTKTDYKFGGWWTGSGGTGASITSTTTVTVAANQTLYAYWEDYVVGDTGPAGGIVFYDKGSYSNGWRYLEAAPDVVGTPYPTAYPWYVGTYQATGATATAVGSGVTNTADIVSVYGTGPYAAYECATYSSGGYSDWFLPAKDELHQMWLHKDVIGGYQGVEYWSSSENDNGLMWVEYFAVGGLQAEGPGTHSYFVRPIREF